MLTEGACATAGALPHSALNYSDYNNTLTKPAIVANANPGVSMSPGGSNAAKGKRCCQPTAPLITSLGVCLLVIGYITLGAFVFMALEGGGSDHEEQQETTPGTKNDQHSQTSGPRTGKLLVDNTVEKLWSITEDLNILYKDNWTRLASQEVLKFQEQVLASLHSRQHQQHYLDDINGSDWSFATAFLYSLTLITTIGYGGTAPKTAWGKTVTVFYALLGIPLTLVYLSTLGETLAANFRRCYWLLCVRAKTDDDRKFSTQIDYSQRRRIPGFVCLLLIVFYILFGSVLLNLIGNWSLLDGAYFSFTSLATIGVSAMASDNEIIIFICSGYILIGMALIAMSFSLAQDNLVYVVKHVTTLKSSPENSASNVHGGASTSPKQREILDSMEDIALTLAVS